MVGASRERVNKAIASFVRLGWIDQSERRYRILDRDQITDEPGSRPRSRGLTTPMRSRVRQTWVRPG